MARCYGRNAPQLARHLHVISDLYRERMTATAWTAEALLARLDVVTALDAAPSPPTPLRARIRLELLDIVAAVDDSRVEVTDAVSLLRGLRARTLDDVNSEPDRKRLSRLLVAPTREPAADVR